MRKYEAIDLLKLYTQSNHSIWNSMLTECLKNHDIRRLIAIRYGIQAGMDDLVKAKLSTEKIEIFFLRLNKSIEDTVRAIVRQKHPLPNDNPLTPKEKLSKLTLEAKRKRDRELSQFFHDSAY